MQRSANSDKTPYVYLWEGANLHYTNVAKLANPNINISLSRVMVMRDLLLPFSDGDIVMGLIWAQLWNAASLTLELFILDSSKDPFTKKKKKNQSIFRFKFQHSNRYAGLVCLVLGVRKCLPHNNQSIRREIVYYFILFSGYIKSFQHNEYITMEFADFKYIYLCC